MAFFNLTALRGYVRPTSCSFVLSSLRTSTATTTSDLIMDDEHMCPTSYLGESPLLTTSERPRGTGPRSGELLRGAREYHRVLRIKSCDINLTLHALLRLGADQFGRI